MGPNTTPVFPAELYPARGPRGAVCPLVHLAHGVAVSYPPAQAGSIGAFVPGVNSRCNSIYP